MNIIEKVKNMIEYAHCRREMKKSIKNAEKHVNDEDSSIFNYWVMRFCLVTKRCLEIKLTLKDWASALSFALREIYNSFYDQ